MEHPFPPLSAPDEPASPDVPSQAGTSNHPSAQRFDGSGVAPHAGAVLSVGGVGIFCLSLLLPWFSTFVPPSDTPGWKALALPPALVMLGLYSTSAGFCGMGLNALALEGLTLYIFATCAVALFKPGIPNPKWWHFNVLLLATVCFFLAMCYPLKESPNVAGVSSGYWVALGSFLVVLVGMVWQKGQIADLT